MGLDVFLKTKYEISYPGCHSYIDRWFCNFLNGPLGVGSNCEFYQIERILQIDLSLYRQTPENLEPDTDYWQGEYYLAEDEGDAVKMEDIKNKIKEAEENWKATYHEINEGWTKVNELRAKTQEFINKILAKQDYWKEMEFNLPWQKYFITDYYYEEPKTALEKEFKKHLLIDLYSILNFLDCAEKENQEYVCFYYG